MNAVSYKQKPKGIHFILGWSHKNPADSSFLVVLEKGEMMQPKKKWYMLSPLVRIVKEIHIPLYLKAYISATFGRAKILEPYATINLLTSRKRRMPLGEDESKVKRWALFRTNSDMNFNIGVVTCKIKQRRGRENNSTYSW